MTEPNLLTVTQAAAALGITDSRVRVLIREGRLPATKYGPRLWLIRAEDLERLVRQPPHRPAKGKL